MVKNMSNIKRLLSVIVFINLILCSATGRAFLTPESEARFAALIQEYFNQEWVDFNDPVERIRTWMISRLLRADAPIELELSVFLLSESFSNIILEVVQGRRESWTAIIATHRLVVMRALPFGFHDDVDPIFRAQVTQMAILNHLLFYPIAINNRINPPDFMNFLRSREAIAIIASFLSLHPRRDITVPQVSAKPPQQDSEPAIMFTDAHSGNAQELPADPELRYSLQRAAELRKRKMLQEENNREGTPKSRAERLEEEKREEAERLAERAKILKEKEEIRKERDEKEKEKQLKRFEEEEKFQHAMRRGAEERAKWNAEGAKWSIISAKKIEQGASRSLKKRKGKETKKRSKPAAAGD